MARRYRIRLDQGEPSPPLRRLKAVHTQRQKLGRHTAGQRYELGYTGREPDKYAKARRRSVVLAKYGFRLKRLKAGEFAYVRVTERNNVERVYTTRVIKIKNPPGNDAPVRDPEGGHWGSYPLHEWKPSIQSVVKVVAAFDPSVDCNGGAWTRPVNAPDWWSTGDPLPSGSSWSYHSKDRTSDCQGSAVDLVWYAVGGGFRLDAQDRTVDYLVELGQEDAPAVEGLQRVISRDRSYRRSNNFEREPYTGVYHQHAHCETFFSGQVCP